MNKSEIKARCVQKLEAQLEDLKSIMADVQESSNNETKSTAGDKHDTARAQAQNEVARIGSQLLNVERMLLELMKVSTESDDFIKCGSFVVTTCGRFYLSVSLGKLSYEDKEFFAVSLQSPIGQVLLGKTKNDTFLLPNGNQCSVTEIW